MATKIKSIPLTGLSTNPNDLSCNDGSLASSINVVHDEGVIKNPKYTSPKLILELGKDNVIYKHKTSRFEMLIAKAEDGFVYYTDGKKHSAKLALTITGEVGSESFEIKDGDTIDLSSYSSELDFDVYAEPVLLIDNKQIGTYTSYYSRKRTGKTEKTVNYDHTPTIFEPMTTSSIAQELTENGAFQMVFVVNIDGIYISKSFGFSYKIDDSSIPSIERYDEDPEKSVLVKNHFSEVVDFNSISVVSLNNLLSIYTESGVYHYYGKLSDETFSYTYKNGTLPNLPMRFSLGSPIEYDNYLNPSTINLSGKFKVNTEDDYHSIVDDSDKTLLKDGLFAEINKFQNEFVNGNGYFSQPFLVRIAYRLYDGSTMMESIPVLITPSEQNNPSVIIKKIDNNQKELSVWTIGYGCKLRYRIDKDEYLENIKKWGDIVESIDFFVSAPIYTYDNSDDSVCDRYVGCFGAEGYTTVWKEGWYTNTKGLLNQLNHSLYGDLHSSRNITDRYVSNNASIIEKTISSSYDYEGTNELSMHLTKIDNDDPYYAEYDVYLNGDKLFSGIDNGASRGYTFGDCTKKSLITYIDVPKKSESAINSEISNTSVFRLVASIKLKNLVSEDWVDVPIEDGVLDVDTFNTLEALTENYESQFEILPKNVISFNGRYVISNIRKKYFDEFNPDAVFQIANREPVDETYIFLEITTDSEIGMLLSCNKKYTFDFDLPKNYFFYPDANAKKLIIFIHNTSSDSWRKLEKELSNHKMLNGVYWFGGLKTSAYSDYAASSEDEYNNYLSKSKTIYDYIDNEIRVSEVNNPFVYKASNVEDVGSGEIISLVPQTQALSQGQFGEYPIICFTTDGIWALYVNTTGGLSSKQPFSRDVVLNEDAGNILQLDRQVMFASNRGLMLVNGSSVECVSELFDGLKDTFNIYKSNVAFDHNNVITQSILPLTDILSTRTDADKDNLFPDFKTFIGNAVFLYDYTHQRVIIGNEDYPFSFVLNMKDKVWTAMCQKITSSVNSYPNCYAMTQIGTGDDKSNLLVDFSATDGNASEVGLPTEGFILTRPIKLGDSTALKTIRTINAQGKFNRSHVDMVLIGCNDNAMQNWFILSSCKGGRMPFRYGTPFKYFRVAIITRLTEGESIESLTIEYEVKETNKLRQ